MAWLPGTSLTFAPARAAIARCAGGGIILSSAATRNQLGLFFQAAVLTLPLSALTPHGTCDAAMKRACRSPTSAANEAANLAWSSNKKPSCGGRIGGTGAPGAGLEISDWTDSPASGAKAVMY